MERYRLKRDQGLQHKPKTLNFVKQSLKPKPNQTYP